MEKTKFHKLGLTGNPIEGELVIDAHMHLETYYNFYIPNFEISDLIANARRIGMQRMYGSSLLAICSDAASGNQNAVTFSLLHPDLFHPYLVFKPNFPEELQQVLHLADSLKINQFKLHDDGNDLRYDHPNYCPLYEYANEKRSVVLFHTYGQKHLPSIMNVAAQFPHLLALLGHSGIVDEALYIDAARKYENIFLETCSSLAWYGLIERMVKKAGADRVVFGSDMPFMSPDQQIGRVLFAHISDEDKRKVLGLNAQNLFAG